MKTFKLHKEQKLVATIDQVWDFFSSPKNLDQLIPDNMGFKIISSNPLDEMFQGQVIEYKVSPIFNIPLYWKTLISEVEFKNHFIDVQIKGPYKLWKHKHVFKQENGYIIMIDKLEYALPFGLLGSLANQLYIKNKLEEIFQYRFEKVNQLFHN